MSIYLAPQQIQVQTGNYFTEVTNGTDSFRDLWGSGSPEGVISANRGSSYRDVTNGAIYVKVTGTGNTGWSALSTGIGNRAANSVFGNPTAASAAAQDIAVAAERLLGRTLAGNLAALTPQEARLVARRERFVLPNTGNGGTVSWDLANGIYQSVVYTGPNTGVFTLAFPSNVTAGEYADIYVQGDLAGIALGSGFELCGGGAPSLATTGTKHRLEIFFDTDTSATVTICTGIGVTAPPAPPVLYTFGNVFEGAVESFVHSAATYTNVGAGWVQDGFAFQFNDAGLLWTQFPIIRLLPGVDGWPGANQNDVPTTANLTVNINQNFIGAGTPFGVRFRGLAGGTAVPPDGNGSAPYPMQAARTVAFSDTQSVTNVQTGDITFDLTSVLTEMFSDGSWNNTRAIYLLGELVSAGSNPGFGQHTFGVSNARLTYGL